MKLHDPLVFPVFLPGLTMNLQIYIYIYLNIYIYIHIDINDVNLYILTLPSLGFPLDAKPRMQLMDL